MITLPIEYGSLIAYDCLNGLHNYLVATNPEPWDLWSQKLTTTPEDVIYCESMEQEKLDLLGEKYYKKYSYIVGLGGGVACDTAKYLAWMWKIPLITIPSIISVDAFLCKEVGVRVQDRVRYMGNIDAEKIIIDYDLIRSAPPHLNWAGVGDVISCATALGDWKMAHQEFDDKFDQDIFDETINLVKEFLKNSVKFHDLSDKGIKKLLEFLIWEVDLSIRWGNARPEEGSEHFLAYALEKIAPARYLHGALVSLNVLIVLKLQNKYAQFTYQEIKQFFDQVGTPYSPTKLGIPRLQFKMALNSVIEYTKDENLAHGLWYLDDPFNSCSIADILDWIYEFEK
jgi:glycerol-1-phosphate dehydrogenase [NAD(P)+]